MFYDNGDVYDGSWYQNLRDGYCMYYHSNQGKWRKELYQKDNFVKALSDYQ